MPERATRDVRGFDTGCLSVRLAVGLACARRCPLFPLPPWLTYHGISYGTHLGAVYANLYPNRVRAMAFDGSMDFEGNATGHGDQGTTVPLDTRQDVPRGIAETFDEFLRQCAAPGADCAFAGGDLCPTGAGSRCST